MNQLRQQLRSLRQSLPITDRAQRSIAITRNLASYLPYQRAIRVASYMATEEEVATETAMEMTVAAGKKVYLPIINTASWRAPPLLFENYVPGETPLRTNRYGIPEPIHRVGTALRVRKMDLVLVPLVGFNDRCDRIGMGSGYYDRSLADSGFRNTRYVGLAFTCQKAEFEPAAHDIPMHAIITEEGIITRGVKVIPSHNK